MHCFVFIPYFSRLMSLSSPREECDESNKEKNDDEAKTATVLKNVSEELTPSLEQVKRLLQSRRRVPQGETPPGPSTSSHALRGSEDKEEEEVCSQSPGW